ncbi:MAG: hydrogenase nickel incorporation protein HypB [Bacteroidetes bacterium]|nr:hydrogenase nickel incorporation protein HypB [Bacteroidota bacterium]
MSVITIERKVLQKNDELAQQNRELFRKTGTLAINLVSSPGSGKTSLLEKTLENLSSRIKTAVVEGDVQTDIDAQRVSKLGVPVVQLRRGGGCHLDAKLVQDALANMELSGIDLLVIENVGNLVCPAGYDLGEAMKIVIASTTEGDDKPLKYPAMFRNASVLIINKTDLLPYVNCKIDELRKNALQINPNLTVFETSCTTGSGIKQWSDWLVSEAKKR